MIGAPNVPNLDLIRKHLLAEGKISQQDLEKLLTDVKAVLQLEPNVMKLLEPVVIVGDIHGQFFDMIHMFEKVIDERKGIKMLFLGDYVDRGLFSIEVLIFLFSLKLNRPKDVVLLRGNHESRAMTNYFTFRNDIMQAYGDQSLYDRFMECFDCMPVAAIVNEDYLCMHGGISPKLTDLQQINQIRRFEEPGLNGLLCDLLWADPVDDVSAIKVNFMQNKERECSVKFGLKPVKALLKKNNFLSIIRAHQVQIDGYRMHRWGTGQAFPSVITVFSAPNYCGSYSNKGAVMLIENEKMNIKQYKEVEHPFHLPGGIDLFTWSLPFLAEKITEMLFNIIGRNNDYSPKSQADLEKVDVTKILDDSQKLQEKEKRKVSLRNKVRTIARLNRILTTLRENSEELLLIKKMSPDGKIPYGLLLEGRPAIRHAFKEFEITKELDRENEKFPHEKSPHSQINLLGTQYKTAEKRKFA